MPVLNSIVLLCFVVVLLTSVCVFVSRLCFVIVDRVSHIYIYIYEFILSGVCTCMMVDCLILLRNHECVLSMLCLIGVLV